MEYKKEYKIVIFYIFLCLFVALLPYAIAIHKFIVCNNCVFDRVINLGVYYLPVAIIFNVLAIKIYRSGGKKIRLLPNGLVVEDFSRNSISWEKIEKVGVVEQKIHNAAPIPWLVLNTRNDMEYMNSKLKKLNKLLGINGVPVANLNMYRESASTIVSSIEAKIKNA